MTTFRDATQEALHNAYHEYKDRHGVFGVVGDMARVQADAVLAMPEMEAVRHALRVLHTHGGPNYLEVGLDLPEHLAAWVLGENQ